MYNDLIGKSYNECGKCYGLCRIVAERLGVDLPSWPEVAKAQAATEIEKAMPLFSRIEDNFRPGDLVHIENFDSEPHIGIIIEPMTMLHATKKHGCHKMRLDHPWIKNRVEGVYRYVAKPK
jgi:hypothetical protein